MRKNKLTRWSIFALFFLALGGYYAALILVANILTNDLSRTITMPIRLIIVLVAISLFFLSRNKKKLTLSLSFFLLFSFVYFIRILVELVQGDILYMSPISFFTYFLSFVFIPIVFISNTKFNNSQYTNIFWAMVFGCFATSILTGYFYNEYIGQVARITTEVKKSDNYISPLALSYVSVLGIGLSLAYIITNTVKKKEFMCLTVVILLCLIPFFLGASRGAIVALIFPFVIYFFLSNKTSNKISFLIIFSFFLVFLFWTSSYFGTGVFERFLNISDAVEQGNSSAVRLLIWKHEILLFLNNPIFGYSLQSDFVNHHPHNVIVESLISTGIIGSVFYFGFLISVFSKSILIIRRFPKDFWLVILFYMGFAQNMFSGAIWGASFLALGAALIIGYDLHQAKREKGN